MNNTIKMVVFDMAGTTVNENNVVYETLQKAINEAGFPVTLEQVLAEGAGKEKLQAIKSVLQVYAHNDDDALAARIYSDFSIQLADAYATQQILPQNNALELFAALKDRGILAVLNTGYNQQTAELVLNRLGWQPGVDFDELVTASDVSKNRPNPDMIIYAMQQFGIANGHEVIKIGDSMIDIEEGKNAGCQFNIGITTGAHTYEQLQAARPDYIIDDLIELLPIIDK